jgi:putative nucleotidyltransferase-like protein
VTDIRERLCACLRQSAAAISTLPEDVLDAARDEGVHLLVADRLRLPSVVDELRAASALEAARERELREVLARLADAGVRPILVKGAALGRTHYPRPELRPRTDTDVMIPPDSDEAVTRTLLTLGYQRVSEVDGRLMTGQFHFHKTDGNELFHALDIHRRISNVRAFANVLTYDELSRDAVHVPSLGPHAWSPSPVHALLIACVHRVAHHGDTDRLLWLFDVHLLADGLSPREQESFTALAAARGLRAVCVKTLRLAQVAFGGHDIVWPTSLPDASGTVEPTAAFLRSGLRQIDLLKADLAATPLFRTRLQLLHEHLFPSPSFMYARYRTRLKLALPWLYLHRILNGAPRWFRR